MKSRTNLDLYLILEEIFVDYQDKIDSEHLSKLIDAMDIVWYNLSDNEIEHLLNKEKDIGK